MKFEDYIRMIHKIAKAKYGQTGIEYEELVGRGTLIFYESVASFDPALASFSTYLYNNLNRKMVCYKELEGVGKEVGIDDDMYEIIIGRASMPHKDVEFIDTVRNLSNEAQEVVAIVFNCPTDLMFEGRGMQKNILGCIKNRLRAMGWKEYQISNSFKEIRTALAA